MKLSHYTSNLHESQGEAHHIIEITDIPATITEREYTKEEALLKAKDRLLSLISEAQSTISEINALLPYTQPPPTATTSSPTATTSRCDTCYFNDEPQSGECYDCIKGIRDYYTPLSEEV